MVDCLEFDCGYPQLNFRIKSNKTHNGFTIELNNEDLMGDFYAPVMSIVKDGEFFFYTSIFESGLRIMKARRGMPVRLPDGFNPPLEVVQELVSNSEQGYLVARPWNRDGHDGVGLFLIEDYVFYDVGFIFFVNEGVQLVLTSKPL